MCGWYLYVIQVIGFVESIMEQEIRELSELTMMCGQERDVVGGLGKT